MHAALFRFFFYFST
ncbi:MULTISPECIES: pheST operon leader peptide PheM [Erwiniaceae]|nr:pheST operon leader peptide PheM [Pantoea sp. 1.19]